jgi:hypothetical protein
MHRDKDTGARRTAPRIALLTLVGEWSYALPRHRGRCGIISLGHYYARLGGTKCQRHLRSRLRLRSQRQPPSQLRSQLQSRRQPQRLLQSQMRSQRQPQSRMRSQPRSQPRSQCQPQRHLQRHFRSRLPGSQPSNQTKRASGRSQHILTGCGEHLGQRRHHVMDTVAAIRYRDTVCTRLPARDRLGTADNVIAGLACRRRVGSPRNGM